MTPDDHIQGVLDRGTGWVKRGKWLVLATETGAWVVVHDRTNDTWLAACLTHEQIEAAEPEEWDLGYVVVEESTDDLMLATAADAAWVVEQAVRLGPILAAAEHRQGGEQ